MSRSARGCVPQEQPTPLAGLQSVRRQGGCVEAMGGDLAGAMREGRDDEAIGALLRAAWPDSAPLARPTGHDAP